jgi:glycine cleavage system aminomethyltransferase T
MRQMSVADGKVVYTPVLSPSGTFKSDLTVMKLGDEQFRVVTGGAHGMADLKWYADHLPEDGSAQITDLTSAYTTLGLWGPRSREILAGLTSDDMSHEAFPFASCRTIELDSLRVLASRISYVGELGWELYVPIEQGAKLWDLVWEAGEPHGVVPAGIGVYGTTGRLEKCYRAFGAELDADYDVAEAGMAWGKVKTPDFIGKATHVTHREQDPVAVLCTLTVDDHTSKDGTKRYMLGREPVLSKNGEPLIDAHDRRSYVTSAGAGPSIGKHILMSYLPPENANVGEELLVEYLGEQYPVTVATNDSTPVFDPDNSRVKS